MKLQAIEIPFPDNAEHTDNLASIALLEAQGFVGPDRCLHESLFEYGLAWRTVGDEILFVYRHPSLRGRFDRCTFKADTKAEREWNWVKWGDVAEYSGSPVHEFLEFPLPEIVQSLVGYYGPEEIFGTSYWEGFAITE